MEIKSVQKNVKITPRKLRLVAGLIKKMSPEEALETLPFIEKKGSEKISKVIKTALANARQKGISEDTLSFKAIEIGEGPRLKRFRPVSRGRAHPYMKRTSHIKVVLESSEKAKPVKEDKK